MHHREQQHYSIISSVVASSIGGIVGPSATAVWGFDAVGSRLAGVEH